MSPTAFLLISVWFVYPLTVLGQTGSGAPTARLSEKELRGKGLFLQRCSVCHMPKGNSLKSAQQFGPSLYGLFNEGSPEREAAIRNIILKGGPDMPGFQYGLKPEDIDSIIAYLKTLKTKPAVPEYGVLQRRRTLSAKLAFSLRGAGYVGQ